MFVYEEAGDALRALGVSHMFGVMGDGNLFAADAFARGDGAHYVAATHESSAVSMAMGYASRTRSVGVATITHGPGLTNALTSVVEAARGNTPVLLLAGEIGTTDQHNPQDISHDELLAPTGAVCITPDSPQGVVDALYEGYALAERSQGIVVVNVPADFWWATGSGRPLPQRPDREAAPETIDSEAMDRAMGLLVTARRPLMLVGQGGISEQARDAVDALASATGAMIATTVKAKDLFHGDPRSLGVLGTLMHEPVVLDAVGRSDCLIVLGASLNSRTTAAGSLVAGKRVIHIDRDPAALGRYVDPDVAIVGDVATAAREILGWWAEGGMEARRQSWWASPDADTSTAAPAAPGPVPIRDAMTWFNSALPRERNVVFDAGRFGYHAFDLLHAHEAVAFVDTLSFASIGLGMSAAVGAAVARPDQPTMLAVGDGGFMMSGLGEFNTAVRYGLDLVVGLFNDRSYGAEYIQLERQDLPVTSSCFDWPGFAELAVALGGEGVRVESAADLPRAQAVIDARTKPLLIEFVIDPANVPIPGR